MLITRLSVIFIIISIAQFARLNKKHVDHLLIDRKKERQKSHTVRFISSLVHPWIEQPRNN